ncbi:MAG TPA: hypothetical protein VJI96_02235 [Candidatus Andersenbacteria bacterium]|nr:hypothetical protein [Candidatus Andersenbacteria bacterium]
MDRILTILVVAGFLAFAVFGWVLWRRSKQCRVAGSQSETADFKKYANALSLKVKAAWDETGIPPEGFPGGYEGLLVQYIQETGKSPFVNDDKLQRRDQLLLRHRVF